MLLPSILQQAIPMHSKQEGLKMSFVSSLIAVVGTEEKSRPIVPP